MLIVACPFSYSLRLYVDTIIVNHFRFYLSQRDGRKRQKKHRKEDTPLLRNNAIIRMVLAKVWK